MYMILFKVDHPFMPAGSMDVRLLRSALFSVGWMQVWDANAAALLRWLLMPCPWQRIKVEHACNHRWLGSYGLGNGSFDNSPPVKLVPDSRGAWYEDSWI